MKQLTADNRSQDNNIHKMSGKIMESYWDFLISPLHVQYGLAFLPLISHAASAQILSQADKIESG